MAYTRQRPSVPRVRASSLGYRAGNGPGHRLHGAGLVGEGTAHHTPVRPGWQWSPSGRFIRPTEADQLARPHDRERRQCIGGIGWSI